jgi:hypothetical protein
MKTILFTNARDENNILEWVVHHLNLGFSHIFIFDHKSNIPIRDTLRNISTTMVTVQNRETVVKKDLIYEAHVYAIQNSFDWMLYLDTDEFLILNFVNNVVDFLIDYKEYDQIGINWLLFGTNYLDTFPGGTLLENYTRCDTALNKHIKSFININLVSNISMVNCYCAHMLFLKNMTNSVNVDYELFDTNEPYFHTPILSVQCVKAYVAHFLYQAYEVYMTRKVFRPRDDQPNTYRDQETAECLHSRYNAHVNTFPMEKYNQKNLLEIEKYK